MAKEGATALEPFHRKVMMRYCITCLILFLGVVPLLAVGLSSRRIYDDLPPWFCLPDGRVHWAWDRQNYSSSVWDIKTLTSINLGFGRFTFGAAKWIDILWDTLVGHGGQAYLTYVAYKVFSKALLYSMETSPAPFDVYAGLSFKSFSVQSLWTVAQEVTSYRRERAGSKAAKGPGHRTWLLAAFVVASMYLLSFSVVVSAMTGYQAGSTSFVISTETDGLVPMSALGATHWGLQNASRVGLDEPFYIVNGSTYDELFLYYLEANNYTGQGGRDRSSNITVDGISYSLTSPLLTFVQFNKSELWYTAENVLFEQSYIMGNSVCSPSGEYHWGFSFLMLFVFCLMTAIFVTVLCAVWWTVYWHSRYDRTDQGFNMYSAVMNLANIVRRDVADDATGLTATELKNEIRERRCLITMDVQGLPVSRREEDVAVRKGLVDPALLPAERGLVGYFFTGQDVQRAKTALPRWREQRREKNVGFTSMALELKPPMAGPYVRVPEPEVLGSEDASLAKKDRNLFETGSDVTVENDDGDERDVGETYSAHAVSPRSSLAISEEGLRDESGEADLADDAVSELDREVPSLDLPADDRESAALMRGRPQWPAS